MRSARGSWRLTNRRRRAAWVPYALTCLCIFALIIPCYTRLGLVLRQHRERKSQAGVTTVRTHTSAHIGSKQGVTVVVLSSGSRQDELRTILHYYLFKCNTQLVPEVMLVWNNHTNIGFELTHLSQMERLRIYVEGKNTLNNRYRHWRDIKTSATLLLDDDCIVYDIAFALQVHLAYPSRIICFYARAHRVRNDSTWPDSYDYVNPRRVGGKYSIGTGQASLLSTTWLKRFNTDARLTKTRAFIDTNRPTCEDIALHMFVSNHTHLGPILVNADQAQLSASTRGMSATRGWGEKRKACLSHFISETYDGMNPLIYSEFIRPLSADDSALIND